MTKELGNVHLHTDRGITNNQSKCFRKYKNVFIPCLYASQKGKYSKKVKSLKNWINEIETTPTEATPMVRE